MCLVAGADERVIACVHCADENDFIVDDEGRPISQGKKKRHIIHDDVLVGSLLFTCISVYLW